MVSLALRLIAAKAVGSLVAQPQDERQATYSVWRDTEDYFIDWTWPAEKIERFIYAVGYPYEGAYTILGDQVVIINACATIPGDLIFPLREPGKVWRLVEGGPIVICGNGLLQILAMQTQDGAEFHLEKPRSRFRTLSETERSRIAANTSERTLNQRVDMSQIK
jgi:methionyl-tRNA formyltransferase